MTDRKQYTKEFKQLIVHKIRNEGYTVAQIIKEYNIPDTNIYRWLEDGVGRKINPDLEIKRLKAEIDELYWVIGQLSASEKK